LERRLKMIRIGLTLLCFILAVGCIDGPTGYENNNWLGCFLFFVTGIALWVWVALDGTLAKINN